VAFFSILQTVCWPDEHGVKALSGRPVHTSVWSIHLSPLRALSKRLAPVSVCCPNGEREAILYLVPTTSLPARWHR